jgi:hypothetical protein
MKPEGFAFAITRASKKGLNPSSPSDIIYISCCNWIQQAVLLCEQHRK